LQQDAPEDFVIATGVQYSVRQFIIWTAEALGIELAFSGNGINEIAVVQSVTGNLAPSVNVGDVVVKIDPRYFRPTEVETLLGDATHAMNKLGWKPEISVQTMCAEMVAHDLDQAKRHAVLRNHGYAIATKYEK
jgi:GDPmannose 4,6-dehydratase